MENYVSTQKKGCITFQKIHLTYKTYESILKDFIAIDTETTGLNSEIDKIVEIGAARFHNGKLINNLYNSFVKTNVPISKESSNINKITNQMIQELGFPEHVVYKEFIDFIQDVTNGNSVIVIYNANFDIGFLKPTLENLGYSGILKYIDLYSLCRSELHECDIENYKQESIANYFNITNAISHRALYDAITCGNILTKLIENFTNNLDYEMKESQLRELKPYELEICAAILKSCQNANLDISSFTIDRSSGQRQCSIDFRDGFSFLRIKLSKNMRYFVVTKSIANKSKINLKTGECTPSENPNENLRVYFNSPSDLLDKTVADAIALIYASYIAKSNKKKIENWLLYNENWVKYEINAIDINIESIIQSINNN